MILIFYHMNVLTEPSRLHFKVDEASVNDEASKYMYDDSQYSTSLIGYLFAD